MLEKHFDTYVGEKTVGFHLISEEKSVLQATAFHGPNDQRVEQVARGLHAVEHHVIVDVPQKEEPSLRSERRNDGVVFGGVVGVVSPGVFLRPRRRREEAAAQGSAHGLVVTCWENEKWATNALNKKETSKIKIWKKNSNVMYGKWIGGVS